MLTSKITWFGRLPRRGIAARWTTPVDLLDPLVDHRQRRHRLAEVGDVGAAVGDVAGFGGLVWPGGGSMSIEVTW